MSSSQQHQHTTMQNTN